MIGAMIIIIVCVHEMSWNM